MKVLLPYIPLRMLPHATRWVGERVKECVFVTRPNFTKVEVKNYLEGTYGMRGIERVDTCNYEGKKKTFTNTKTKKKTFFRRQDFKKAYVTFKVRIWMDVSMWWTCTRASGWRVVNNERSRASLCRDDALCRCVFRLTRCVYMCVCRDRPSQDPIEAPPYLLAMKRNAEEVNRRQAAAANSGDS